jgi:2-oxo-4-hydroxy-4-carboxy-5-ureidoimidazoline decarboxylase
MARMSIAAVNEMSVADYVATFGDIAEHSPFVAEGAAAERPHASRQAMAEAFEKVLRGAAYGRQLAVLRAHPDLAGRAAIADELTEDSRREQRGAGLDSLTPEEFERFTELNNHYRETFGFPFIFAVKGATKDMILDAFEARVENGRAEELETALAQVARILRFRIEDRVLP